MQQSAGRGGFKSHAAHFATYTRLAGLRERHFAGGVQEKNPSYCSDLNTIETKGMDGAPSGGDSSIPFASDWCASPARPALWSYRSPLRSTPPPTVEAGTTRREVYAMRRPQRPVHRNDGSPDGKPTVGDRWSPIARRTSGRSPAWPFEVARGLLLHSLWITCGVRHTFGDQPEQQYGQNVSMTLSRGRSPGWEGSERDAPPRARLGATLSFAGASRFSRWGVGLVSVNVEFVVEGSGASADAEP